MYHTGNIGKSCSVNSASPFLVLSIYKIGSHELFAQGWLQTEILLISASGVVKITGMSLQCPAPVLIVCILHIK
jgi:hypothetical protein